MAIDLEADDPVSVGDASGSTSTIPDSSPAPSTSSPSSGSSPDDPYDFDAPGLETPAEVPAETPADSQSSATVASVAPNAAPTVSPALAQRAAAAGFSPEVLAKINDPLALEAVVRTAEQAAVNAAMFMQRQAQTQGQFAQPAQQAAPAVAPEPQAPAALNEGGLRSALREKGFHDDLIEQQVEMAKQHHALATQQYQLQHNQWKQEKYNAEVHQYLLRKDAEIAQMRQAHQMELVDRDYAGFSGKLPEAHQKLVNDPNNKQQIYQMAAWMADGMNKAGQPLPPNSELFNRAMYSVLGEKLYGNAVEQVRQDTQKHQARATARPSAGRASAPSGASGDRESNASRFVENFFRGLGVSGGSSAANILPDV